MAQINPDIAEVDAMTAAIDRLTAAANACHIALGKIGNHGGVEIEVVGELMKITLKPNSGMSVDWGNDRVWDGDGV